MRSRTSGVMTVRRLPDRCRAVIVLAAASACAACSRPAPTESSVSEAPSDRRAIADFATRLGRVGATAAAVSDDKACPEPTPRNEPLGAALVADAAALARLSSRRAPAVANPNDPWRPLTSTALREFSLVEPNSDDAARDVHFHIVELEQRYRHLAVVRSTSRVAPELHGE